MYKEKNNITYFISFIILRIGSIFSKETRMFLASLTGDYDTVKYLIDKKNVNLNNSLNPLFIASAKGHVNIVELLLKNGADINAKEKRGWTPIMAAVQNENNASVVQILLKHEATVNDKSNYGITALIIASSKESNIEVVKMLLEKGADIEAKGGYAQKETPLIVAAFRGNTNIAEILLDYGANIEAKNSDGETALLVAIRHRKINTANLLLKRGADFYSEDYNGLTPKRWAEIRRYDYNPATKNLYSS